jgi:periplasmic protein TonB
MRNLSCYLSSISLHALAVAIVTAATVFETPDFAVTTGGVSIAGSQASIEIDTRVDFQETSPVDLAEKSPAVSPFQVAPSDTATVASAERRPAPPKVDVPPAPARPLAATLPRAIVEPLLIPHDGLLERIGEEPERPAPPLRVAQVAPEKPPAESEPVDPKPEPSVERTPKPAQAPKLPAGKKPQKESSPRKEEKPTKQDSPEKIETAKPASIKDPATSAAPREAQKPEQKATKQSDSKAAPSSSEPAGAKVEQLPRKLATNASPTYPLDAWQKRQEGVVYLLVRVSSSGLADSVTVYRSSGFKSLDAAAEKTVKGWKFQPARRAGKPVASPVVVPVRFRIQSQ